MSLTNFPNGLSSFGFPLIGSGPVLTTGHVWFVNSVTGTDASGRGTDPSRPFASIDFAVGQCTASAGDVIFAMPGHVETISAAGGLTMDVAGVSVVGLGNGTNRPYLNLGTVVGATVTVSAANITFENIVMDMATALDAIAVGFTVTGAYFTIRGCKIIQANASGQGLVAISLGSGADNAQILYTEIDSTNAGATSAIASAAAVSGLTIQWCNIYGNFSTGTIVSASTNHITNMFLDRNRFSNQNGTAKAIWALTTSSTGIISNNVVKGTSWSSAADVLTGASNADLNFLQNFGFDVGGAASGVLVPAVGTIS